jgi:hypothetical protein
MRKLSTGYQQRGYLKQYKLKHIQLVLSRRNAQKRWWALTHHQGNQPY